MLIPRIVSDVPVADTLPSHYLASRDGPFIVVEGDGTPTASPIHTVQSVRIILHAESRPEAIHLMDVLDALLLARSAIGVGIRISPGQRIIVVKDGDGDGTHYIASAGYSVAAEKKELQL